MNRKLQLFYLIEQYCNGKYDTQTFSSLMTKIYYIEKDDSLSEKDEEILSPLAHCADYFSPYLSDHEIYSGFTNEKEVKQFAMLTYKELLSYYDVDSFEQMKNS